LAGEIVRRRVVAVRVNVYFLRPKRIDDGRIRRKKR